MKFFGGLSLARSSKRKEDDFLSSLEDITGPTIGRKQQRFGISFNMNILFRWGMGEKIGTDWKGGSMKSLLMFSHTLNFGCLVGLRWKIFGLMMVGNFGTLNSLEISMIGNNKRQRLF